MLQPPVDLHYHGCSFSDISYVSALDISYIIIYLCISVVSQLYISYFWLLAPGSHSKNTWSKVSKVPNNATLDDLGVLNQLASAFILAGWSMPRIPKMYDLEISILGDLHIMLMLMHPMFFTLDILDTSGIFLKIRAKNLPKKHISIISINNKRRWQSKECKKMQKR